MSSGQVVAHTHVTKGAVCMETQKSILYLNDGQTKVTLIGKWFHMTPEEISQDFQARLNLGDTHCTNIHNVLCEVLDKVNQ